MEITVEELEKLNKGDYVIYDIRDSLERSYGYIPDSISITPEEIENRHAAFKSKTAVIYCARGVVSLEAAEKLCRSGIKAYSLKEGYISWLRNEMKRQNADTVCQDAERSLHKKFKKNIFGKFID